MAKCTYIDGIASSQAIDTAGEIVDLEGLDCSSLVGGAFNWEHKSDVPAQLIGKVLEYKKIFSAKDCETDRHRHYWNKCKIPFLYVLGRLLDDKKDSAKEAADLFLDDAQNPHEPQMVGFSIEGAKIHKEGMRITHSIARKVTVTNAPANKTCVAEMLPKDAKKPKDDIDSLFKGEIEFFNPNSAYLEFLQKKEKDMKKDDLLLGGSLAASEDMKKSMPSWSTGKQKGDAVHFSHPEHGTVSVHKENGAFHVKHQGASAGLKGVAGSFKTAGEAGKHAQNYMAAVSQKKILSPQMHNRNSPQMVGKFNPNMNKALDAGSGMAAPSELTQGSALAKEARIGTLSSAGEKKPKKERSIRTSMTSIRVGSSMGSMGGMGKSEWLIRAEEAYGSWEKKEQFEKFMKERLPHLTKGEIRAIGKVLALKKSIDSESSLAKMMSSFYGKKEKELDKTTDIMMASESDKTIKKKD